MQWIWSTSNTAPSAAQAASGGRARAARATLRGPVETAPATQRVGTNYQEHKVRFQPRIPPNPGIFPRGPNASPALPDGQKQPPMNATEDAAAFPGTVGKYGTPYTTSLVPKS